MNTYLAWLYTNKGSRLREVPVSERSGFRRFECVNINKIYNTVDAGYEKMFSSPICFFNSLV